MPSGDHLSVGITLSTHSMASMSFQLSDVVGSCAAEKLPLLPG